MDGATFFASLCNIVGAETARRYAMRFGHLDHVFYDKLLNYEGLAFFAYSTELNHYEIINRALWSGSPSSDILVFAEVLNEALAKLTPYVANDRVAYRGYSAPNVAAFVRSYPPGGSIVFHGFTSASFKADLAFGGNVLFIIRTLTGKAIWHLAANYDEFEVLIPSGRAFTVSAVEHEYNRVLIYLEELP